MSALKTFEVGNRVEGTSAKVLDKRESVVSVDTSKKTKVYEVKWFDEGATCHFTNRSLKKIENMDEGQEGPVNNFPPPTRRFDLSIADDGEDEREGSDDGSVVNSVDDDIDNEVHPEDGLNDLENTVENR